MSLVLCTIPKERSMEPKAFALFWDCFDSGATFVAGKTTRSDRTRKWGVEFTA